MKTTLNTPFSINPDIKGVFDADGKDLLDLSDNDDAELVRVVNQHDQLTAINKELIEALTVVITDIAMSHSIHAGNMIGPSTRKALNSASDAIKRAKELTNEGIYNSCYFYTDRLYASQRNEFSESSMALQR